jgi:hypothetical protein
VRKACFGRNIPTHYGRAEVRGRMARKLPGPHCLDTIYADAFFVRIRFLLGERFGLAAIFSLGLPASSCS